MALSSASVAMHTSFSERLKFLRAVLVVRVGRLVVDVHLIWGTDRELRLYHGDDSLLGRLVLHKLVRILQDGVSQLRGERGDEDRCLHPVGQLLVEVSAERQDLRLPPVDVGLDVPDVFRLLQADDLEHQLHRPQRRRWRVPL